jgi:hypothetical protein
MLRGDVPLLMSGSPSTRIVAPPGFQGVSVYQGGLNGFSWCVNR